jgi:HK97 family phage prohead protease
MNKLFNLTSTFKSHEADDGSVMIRGMASTADFDRAGDSISAEAWTKGGLSNFEKNPIILFNHDYDKPIGRATGLKAGPDGLELECKISKAAPANVAQLVKDGVLGAFSVGFRVKDADYLKETDGLMIKDAELFEVSVVSVPCNQSATFSLAKSFDSDEEYNEFKKTFTNRVDLAGQSLAKDEVNTSSVASDTPKSAEKSADQEIKMDNQNIDLEAFAKKVAEDTAAKIAMKQAEQKAADEATAKAAQEADEAKALEAESIKTVINSGVESGVEKLMGDVEAKLAEKDANLQEIMGTFQKELDEKKAEIEAMQNSKKSFSDRGSDLSAFGKDFLGAHILGKVTGKGYDTDYAKSIMAKAGVAYTANASDAGKLDTLSTAAFEEEMVLEQKVAGLFRELAVNSGATVIPTVTDTNTATFSAGGLESGYLTNRTPGTANSYDMSSVTAYANRLISGTYIPSDTDEQTFVTILPMIQSALARAHARAVDQAILFGTGSLADGATAPVVTNFKGLVGSAGVDGSNSITTSSTAHGGLAGDGGNSARNLVNAVTAMTARAGMGKYGINPADVAYIMGTDAYYSMIDDVNNGADFTSIDEVGPGATKLSGQLGSVYGSPVIVSDLLDSANGGAVDVDGSTGTNTSNFKETSLIAVNRNAFVIPRLGGVNIESDYEVAGQRTAVVASQSLGFTQLEGGTSAAIRVTTTA